MLQLQDQGQGRGEGASMSEPDGLLTPERLAEIRKHEDYARRQVAHVDHDLAGEREWEQRWKDLRALLADHDAQAQQLADANRALDNLGGCPELLAEARKQLADSQAQVVVLREALTAAIEAYKWLVPIAALGPPKLQPAVAVRNAEVEDIAQALADTAAAAEAYKMWNVGTASHRAWAL